MKLRSGPHLYGTIISTSNDITTISTEKHTDSAGKEVSHKTIVTYYSFWSAILEE